MEKCFPNRYTDLAPRDSRLVLPFYDREKNIIGIQGRALMKSKMRYITTRRDKDVHLIYGLERHSSREKTYVVEGPIDSLFLPNCLAVASSDLKSITKKVCSDFIFCFDNEPRNTALVKLMRKVILGGYKICMWPSIIKEKDINLMVLSGLDVQKIIDDNTYQNFEAEIRLNEWKRC